VAQKWPNDNYRAPLSARRTNQTVKQENWKASKGQLQTKNPKWRKLHPLWKEVRPWKGEKIQLDLTYPKMQEEVHLYRGVNSHGQDLWNHWTYWPNTTERCLWSRLKLALVPKEPRFLEIKSKEEEITQKLRTNYKIVIYNSRLIILT